MTIINEHYEVLDTYHGLMLVNRHDPSMYLSLKENQSWEREMLSITKEYATGIVLDIGANIGTHSLIYALTAERVFAFEPQPFVFDNLCANLLLNHLLNVTPVQCALSNEDGYTTMQIQDPTVLNSPAGCRVGEGTNKVAMKRLDSLGLPKVNFIKIDVEAHESEVLQGAVQTLKRDKPVVYIEIHYNALILPIVNFMERLGYIATPEIVTHIFYPPEHIAVDADMLEVYGYLFRQDSLT